MMIDVRRAPARKTPGRQEPTPFPCERARKHRRSQESGETMRAVVKFFAPARRGFYALFSGEDRFSLLEEGGDALREIGGAETFALPLRLEFESGGEVGLEAAHQSGFDPRKRDGRSVRKSFGQRVNDAVKLANRQDAVEHAHLQSLLS